MGALQPLSQHVRPRFCFWRSTLRAYFEQHIARRSVCFVELCDDLQRDRPALGLAAHRLEECTTTVRPAAHFDRARTVVERVVDRGCVGQDDSFVAGRQRADRRAVVLRRESKERLSIRDRDPKVRVCSVRSPARERRSRRSQRVERRSTRFSTSPRPAVEARRTSARPSHTTSIWTAKALAFERSPTADRAEDDRRTCSPGHARADPVQPPRDPRLARTRRRTWFRLLASCQLHGLDAEQYPRELAHVFPQWPRDCVLELCPRDWARTRSRLVASVLEREFGPITIPPAEEQ